MKKLLCLFSLLFSLHSFSQQHNHSAADQWADSVFKSLNDDQKIAQLMVVRMSALDGKKVVFYEKEVKEAVKKYNVGGICLFQGGPQKQAALVNEMQASAKTPLLISIDAENGLGMRMDSVLPLPRQMMLGAVTDPALMYEYGRLVGEQCKRAGIQMNYAPVVDVNNNRLNPVINDRSFGEDKYKVALMGIQYMRGMQDVGVMACAKHFPGHGDVTVDSHFDLPVINKSRALLDSLELYPFKQIIQAGVGAVMVAHLSVPALEDKEKIATSISENTVTGLLRKEFGYGGLILTDALEMKGVSKYFPAGEISVKALEAGNDMLCLPGDIPGSIKKIKEAIAKKRLSWKEINEHVRKVLLAKYRYGLASLQPVETDHITEDINAKSDEMRRLVAQHAITLLRNDDAAIFPLATGKRVAYIGVGLNKDNMFAKQLREEYDAHVYYFDYDMGEGMISPMMDILANRYDVIVIGIHQYSRFPAKNFGISSAAQNLVNQLQQRHRTITMYFGNPYPMHNSCDAKVLLACYEDDNITQQTAADLLQGRLLAKGKLPITVCETLKYGQGIISSGLLPLLRPADLGFNASKLVSIDSVMNDAIRRQAIPGGVVLVAKDGKIAYERAFGYMGYDSTEAVYPETVYDLASVTKILATTLSVMKLYDEGKINLTKTLGDYLPWTKGSNKEKLIIWNVLLHEAGLKGWIPFFRETIDTLKSSGRPSYSIYASVPDSFYPVRVAENIYMRRDWTDTLYKRILESTVGPQGIYLYSDLDFIFLGKIVESITQMPLDQYVKKTFYDPLKMTSTTFKPREHLPLNNIAPTENEPVFRRQLIRGDVHDPAAAMLGGVAGHAGLFSTVYDVAVVCQMLLNGGSMNGVRFFKKETIDLFTSYHSNSRRGLGFDKPEKDNYSRAEPYPSASVSSSAYGHTGFTGTCVWVDPAYNLIYVFLSNRVYNNGDPNRFNRMNIRPKIQEIIYQSLGAAAKFPLAKMESQNL